MATDLDISTREPDAGLVEQAAPWWQGAAIYQIYPRSFADADGDGTGDLRGATERLDHVAWLGCDAIWISPFFTSPMADFGYDVADYCAVDPVFGTLDDFDRLVARAHALGLKVIIDQVYSHSSDEHPWFIESRSSRDNAKADWYVWADPKPDGSPPNNWQSVFGGPSWTWDARREQYYHHNFLKEQPQLNLHRRDVQEKLLGVARFWLDRGVDGFRFDALNFAMHDPALTDNPAVHSPSKRTRPFDFQHHLHNQSHPDLTIFIERLRALLDEYPDRFSVAEVGGEQSSREMKLFTQGARRLHSAYGFDFLYADALTPELVRQSVRNWPGAPEEGWPSWAFSNHDAPRFASRWWREPERAEFVRLALLVLACLRGTIIIYQGEELGLPQADVGFDALRDPEAIANWPQTLGRDGARTPMPWTGDTDGGFGSGSPWLPIDPVQLSMNVADQKGDGASILHWARHVLRLRGEHEALRTGSIAIIDSDPRLLAFTRAQGHDALLCLFNLGDTPLPAPNTEGRTTVEQVGEGLQGGMLAPRSAVIVRGA